MKLTPSQEFAKQLIINNKYTVITGDRQVGKSTLLLEITKQWLNGNTLNIEDLILVYPSQIIADTFELEFKQKFKFINTIHFVQGIENVKKLHLYTGKKIGIFIDDADHPYGSKIPDIINHKNVQKFVMTGVINEKNNEGFFSDIVKTCQMSEWCTPVFKHYNLV